MSSFYELAVMAVRTVLLICICWLMTISIRDIAKYLILGMRWMFNYLQNDRYKQNSENCSSFTSRPTNTNDFFCDPVVSKPVCCKSVDVEIKFSAENEYLQSLCLNSNQTRAHKIWRRRRGKISKKNNYPNNHETNDRVDDSLVCDEENFVDVQVHTVETKTILDHPNILFYNISCHDEYGRELILKIKTNESQIIKMKTSRHRRQRLRDRIENRCGTSGIKRTNLKF